jgi:DNA-binding NtrC family response regulator
MLEESNFDLVLLDLRLPQMAGDTFFLAIVRRWPRLLGRVILMSGAPPEQQPDWPTELSECPILIKPFRLEALAELVETVISKADAGPDLLEGNGQA